MRQEPITSKIQHYAHQTLIVGLGALGKLQREGGKLFNDLVKEGKAVEARNKKAAQAKTEAKETPNAMVKTN
jgi:poly(hydroxyalkanoate) granule-associated protein